MDVFSSLLVYARLPSRAITTPLGRLPVWKRCAALFASSVVSLKSVPIVARIT